MSCRGDEPICYRGPLCQLLLSKRAAQVFSHTMKPVKNEKIVYQQKQITDESNNCWSNLNALRAARNSFVGRVFVTPDVVQDNSDYMVMS